MSSEIRAVLSIALICGAGAAVQAQEAVTARLAGLPRDVACAPLCPAVRPDMRVKVAAGKERVKTLFGNGDALVITGGTAQGVRTGDEFFVRRVVADNFTECHAARSHRSACTPRACSRSWRPRPTPRSPSSHSAATALPSATTSSPSRRLRLPPELAGGTPDFARPGRLILGDERRQIGGAGEFMILDRGSDHGVRAGQPLTIFRHTLPDGTGPVSTSDRRPWYVVRAGDVDRADRAVS